MSEPTLVAQIATVFWSALKETPRQMVAPYVARVARTAKERGAITAGIGTAKRQRAADTRRPGLEPKSRS
jgi:hypothetical protein